MTCSATSEIVEVEPSPRVKLASAAMVLPAMKSSAGACVAREISVMSVSASVLSSPASVDAVAVEVAPDPQGSERGVGCRDLAVGVGIERRKRRKAGGLGVAEQLVDGVDRAVGVEVAREQAVVALDPAGALGESVAVDVEIDAVPLYG